MGQDNLENTAESQSAEKKSPKTVVFIPCCGTKEGAPNYDVKQVSISETNLPQTWNCLKGARSKMQPCIDVHDTPKPAVNLYYGNFYKAVNNHWTKLLKDIDNGELRIFVISAGYGIVDLCQPIQKYDAVLKNDVASIWRKIGLSEIIGELISTLSPQLVYGYFSGKCKWNKANSNYRYFFTEGATSAALKKPKIKCIGCFYNKSGRGVASILGALGKTLVEHSKEDFDPKFGLDAKDTPIHFPSPRGGEGVKISFDLIHNSSNGDGL